MTPQDFLSSSVWVLKMKTYFQVMDVNQDGVLSLSDYEQVANRLAEQQKDLSKSEEIYEVFRSLFHNFVAGGNPETNIQVDVETFLANAAKAVSSMQSAPDAGRKKNEVFFDFVDADASGVISQEEYRRYLAIYSGGDNSNRADQAFASIDVDGDNFINRNEFVEAHMRYWFEPTDDLASGPLPYGPLISP